MRLRGFELVEGYEGVALPKRHTAMSAGYDLASAEDVVIEPRKIALVPTGVRAYMQPDEYLGIHLRSGFSIRNTVSAVNGEGIIDADYYDSDSGGHIFIAIMNHGDAPVHISKGERIAQGIFYKYLAADGDSPGTGEKRRGGIGSTGTE